MEQREIEKVYAFCSNELIQTWLIMADATLLEQEWQIRPTKFTYETLAELSYCHYFIKKELPKSYILRTLMEHLDKEQIKELEQFLKDLKRGKIDKWIQPQDC